MNYTAPSGTIMSDNYPHSYPESTECEWHIVVNPYHFIAFEIVDYDVGANTGSDKECGFYVSLYPKFHTESR